MHFACCPPPPSPGVSRAPAGPVAATGAGSALAKAFVRQSLASSDLAQAFALAFGVQYYCTLVRPPCMEHLYVYILVSFSLKELPLWGQSWGRG
jgi:hypothetical protein